MKQGLLLKFTQNPSARNHLCATRDAVLVSTYAVGGLWGVRKIKEYDAEITDASKWQGENRLGALLVELRQHFFAEKERQHKEVSDVPPKTDPDRSPFHHELQRSDFFHDLSIDAELGRFCGMCYAQKNTARRKAFRANPSPGRRLHRRGDAIRLSRVRRRSIRA